jgi:tetratricopeptide (TPR) repeat protein
MASRAQTPLFVLVVAGFWLVLSGNQPAQADDLRHKPDMERKVSAAGEALAKPTEEIRPGLAGSFLSGRFAKRHQDLKEAARYLSETLQRDPGNERLQHEAMRMHLLAGNVDQAIALAITLQSNASQDPLVVCLLMLKAVQANDYPQAIRHIQASAEVGLFGLIRPVILQWLAIASGAQKTVPEMQDTIDKSGFFSPFLTYHQALMHDVLGDQSAAQLAYGKANADAAVSPYRVVEVFANFYARQGKWDEAQAVFDRYAKANPDSSLVPGKLDPMMIPKPLVSDGHDGLAELFFTTASILFGDESTQDSFLYLRIALALRPKLPPAQLMLANLYEQVEDYKQAIAVYDAIAEDTVFYRRAQVRKALNLEAMGQKDQAIALLDATAKRYSADATSLITKGDMLREAQDYMAASVAYTQAIARTEPLSANDWPLLYARGISYERSGEWPLAEDDFNRALLLSPNQPDVLNYLAYSWLTMNKNIGKAREYLAIALAERPDDAHIIDSVGWSHYLAGDFKKAVKELEKDIEIMPDDVTVNDHLGDAYWRVGRQTEARYQWERALGFKPDQEIADALREKINKGLAALPDQPESSASMVKPAIAPSDGDSPSKSP